MGAFDENDRLRAGVLPADPEDDTVAVDRLDFEGWSEPMLFHDTVVPAFPVDVLPPWMATWCAQQATAIQVPHDLPALLALAVVSLAISKKVAVEIKPGWREPTNLYVAVALPPGLGKSPIFSAATAPLRRWEREERARIAPTIADASERSRVREERVRTLRKRAATANTESERLDLENELRELAVMEADEAVPVALRLIADDATPEAVGRLLSEQRGKLGVFSSEGGPFKILAGRYSGGLANCELFCKAHPGDAYDLDRIGRPSIHLSAPLLTIALTVQPEVVAGLASTPEFRSLGLLARFLYAIPLTNLGRRHPNPDSVSDLARSQYEGAIRTLLAIKADPDEHGEIVSQPILLSSEAREALVAFKAALEPRLGPSGDMSSFADWGNKLPGLAARLAGVLHVADHVDHAGLGAPIDATTMDRAIRIGTYAIDHARAAFGLMGADSGVNLAKMIWAWVVRIDRAVVTKHEIHRAMQSRVNRAAELDPALDLLLERGMLRELRLSGPRPPGRPSVTFAINPRAKQ
jgi:hypothetical protein